MDTNSMIITMFMVLCVFLCINYFRRIQKNKKIQAEHIAKEEVKKEKYEHITSSEFDEIPDEELTHAILYHIMHKEDMIYESDDIDQELVDTLTTGEKYIYAIYQIENSISTVRNGSIHTYFLEEPYKSYVPYVEEALKIVGCLEASKLMEAAHHLATLIEEDREDDDDSEYSTYNFSDFTNAITTELRSSNIVKRMGDYIRSNKDDFIDKD
ncbi:MAG: hypothetical protein PHH04_01180 [Thomasclavelia sp.]|jgi:hypothetical protein|nr:hypothetical protein [Thomasclavelia sp.]